MWTCEAGLGLKSFKSFIFAVDRLEERAKLEKKWKAYPLKYNLGIFLCRWYPVASSMETYESTRTRE